MIAPAYLARLLELWRSGRIAPGAVTHIDILHDAGCALLKGLTACDCEPDVRLRDGDGAPPRQERN